MRWRNGTRTASLVAVGVLALGGLAACGDDDGGSDGGGDGGGDGGSSDASGGKVGVILPDATTSPRWETQDRPSLQAAFDEAGIDADIQNAQGDVEQFGRICDGMINDQVNVIMITNLDSDSGKACLSKAADAGIPSIDYDRLTLGGGASYYVSFDNVRVGELMGEGLITCLDDESKTQANIVYINGLAADNNASLFKEGYENALADKIDSGDYSLVGDQAGDWDATVAGNAFEQLLTANQGKIDGVVSANDTMAGGIIARLRAQNLNGQIPVTGQDASVEGLQNILKGDQCMTVYKNTNLEAETAAKVAIALITGSTDDADALVTGTVPDSETGEDVPSILAEPVSVTVENMQQVFDDGSADPAEVCSGDVAQLCEEAGVGG
ncbi:substrate-binding domain-containing protein [Nocardioides marinquilinus]|uniref:Substrate-binding domain-containing protein n=1 Tax=Nocardioides marinquilinus TaxID=1210400 RepID=A0ABP9Q038_9ACTN